MHKSHVTLMSKVKKYYEKAQSTTVSWTMYVNGAFAAQEPFTYLCKKTFLLA